MIGAPPRLSEVRHINSEQPQGRRLRGTREATGNPTLFQQGAPQKAKIGGRSSSVGARSSGVGVRESEIGVREPQPSASHPPRRRGRQRVERGLKTPVSQSLHAKAREESHTYSGQNSTHDSTKTPNETSRRLQTKFRMRFHEDSARESTKTPNGTSRRTRTLFRKSQPRRPLLEPPVPSPL